MSNQPSSVPSSFSSLSDPTVPEGAELLAHQIAGHRFGESKNKLGLLRHTASGDILKPICDKRSRREQEFYELVFADANNPHPHGVHHHHSDDPCVRQLRSLLPRYNGLFVDHRMSVSYIRLADQTKTLRNASVLDMKMGRITYDPEASEEKIRTELGKYRYATEIGFRILGMRVFDHTTKQYIVKDKHFGTEVTPDNAAQALLTFVQHDLSLLTQFHTQVTHIRRWFRELNVYRWKFISSSLFFVYGEPIDEDEDAVMDGEEAPGLEPKAAKRAIIKMIDFAHVFPNPKRNGEDHQDGAADPHHGIDENYLFGLDKLDYYLEQAAAELKKKAAATTTTQS